MKLVQLIAKIYLKYNFLENPVNFLLFNKDKPLELTPL